MQSMEQVYKEYAETVYKFLMSKTGNKEIAEELTQETFYQAIKSIDRYDKSCRLSTWLCGIAKNQLFIYQRKHPVQDSLDENPELIQTKLASYETPETQAIQAMDRIALMKALHNIDEPYKEVLYLRIFGNLSFREIGEILSKTENWARVTFYRGKEKLIKLL